MSKKELLSDIVLARNGLTIENVFGEVAWAMLQELQAHDVIVACGNGPVRSFHGGFIENAKLVIRCNRYLKDISSEERRGSEKDWSQMRCAIRVSPWRRVQKSWTEVFA